MRGQSLLRINRSSPQICCRCGPQAPVRLSRDLQLRSHSDCDSPRGGDKDEQILSEKCEVSDGRDTEKEGEEGHLDDCSSSCAN
jgi:hypothetical protein